jgi:hypothetical protein
VHEIIIEFLRRGPAHNQLLSPLTEYLVLCANRPAQSFRVPCEHAEFLEHLASLRYQAGDEAPRSTDDRVERSADNARALHLRQVQSLLTRIVSDIDGLEAEVIQADKDWLQLRLVLGPAELSLLPFEFANCPNSLAGNNLPLALNAQRPLVITREVRQNRSRAFRWHGRPKVLVVTTDFPGAPVPIRAHLAGLRKALDPWIRKGGSGLPGGGEEYWKVIERATIEDIRKACSEERYTHVHILAHGAMISATANRGYGIVLHSPSDGRRCVVDGTDLATALCQPRSSGQMSRPFVVVLASCDSGAAPDVEYSGAGTAQLLHTAGIPFVLASQYPLSAVGSAAMVTELYPRLFRGEDPRRALYFVRQRLRTSVPSTHDWASIVAYACLPEDLQCQLLGLRLERMLEMLTVAKDWYDPGALAAAQEHSPNPVGTPTTCGSVAAATEERHNAAAVERRSPVAKVGAREPKEEWQQRILLVERLQEEVLQEIESKDGQQHWRRYSEVCGLLGSNWKGEAYNSWLGGNRERSLQLLRLAHFWYERGHSERVLQGDWAVSHWNATQYLCLTAVLKGHLQGKDALWLRARASAHAQMYAHAPEDQLWAMGSLLELWMLRPLTTPSPPDAHWEMAKQRAIEFAKSLGLWGANESRTIASTLRQLTRYTKWWCNVQTDWPDFNRVVDIAQALLAELGTKPDISLPAP